MRSGNKIDIKELENSTCVKRAKNTTALGQLVNHYLGKTTLACKSGAKVAAWTGYKVLARNEKESLVSAFDGSAYLPGIWREETPMTDHGAAQGNWLFLGFASLKSWRRSPWMKEPDLIKLVVLRGWQLCAQRGLPDTGCRLTWTAPCFF